MPSIEVTLIGMAFKKAIQNTVLAGNEGIILAAVVEKSALSVKDPAKLTPYELSDLRDAFAAALAEKNGALLPKAESGAKAGEFLDLLRTAQLVVAAPPLP